MKRFRSLCGTLIILGIFSPGCLAGADGPMEPQELLAHARAVTARASFASELSVSRDGKSSKTVRIHRKEADNGFIQERIENIWPDASPEVCIVNSSGAYVTLGENRTRLRSSPVNSAFLYRPSRYSYEDRVKYTLEDGNYLGTPCYKLSLKLPLDTVFLEELEKQFSGADSAKYVRTRVPFTRTYLIDKQRNFIYGYTAYNGNDEELFSIYWGKVHFDAPIADALFATPPGEFKDLERNEIEKQKYIRSVFLINSTPNNRPPKKQEPPPSVSDQARDLLLAAMRESRKMNFQATLKVNRGGKYNKTIRAFHCLTPDGTVREWVDHTWADGWRETYILDGSTYFTILNKMPIKTEFPHGSRRFIYENIKSDIVEDAEYILEDSSYRGKPCHRITVKFPTTPQYIEDRIKRYRRFSSRSVEELRQNLPFAKTFLVDKKNKFIYAFSAFNLLGRRLVEAEWGDVNFNPAVNERIFLPPGGKIQIATSRRQFARMRERYLAELKDERKRKR